MVKTTETKIYPTKLYPWPAAFATGLTTAVLYVLCYLFVWQVPDLAAKIFNYWFHSLEINIQLPTVTQFFAGLVSMVAIATLSAAFLIFTYNLCYVHCKKRKLMGVE